MKIQANVIRIAAVAFLLTSAHVGVAGATVASAPVNKAGTAGIPKGPYLTNMPLRTGAPTVKPPASPPAAAPGTKESQLKSR